MARIAIVFHSGYGHTAKQAEAVAAGARGAGAEVTSIPVAELAAPDAPHWATLDAADAIVFGSPTYMGTMSAPFATFKDATSGRWMKRAWANKLAAGFTNSASMNGDKQNTLMSFVVLAMQHGMLWVGQDMLPGNNSSTGSPDDLNRLGVALGAAAQSNADEGPDKGPTPSDLRTAEHFGARIAATAARLGPVV